MKFSTSNGAVYLDKFKIVVQFSLRAEVLRIGEAEDGLHQIHHEKSPLKTRRFFQWLNHQNIQGEMSCLVGGFKDEWIIFHFKKKG